MPQSPLSAPKPQRSGLDAQPPAVRDQATKETPDLPDMTRISGWGSSSMEGIGPEFQAMAQEFGATYVQGGKGGERVEQTAARLGSRPALVTVVGGVLPAQGEVEVTCSNIPDRIFLLPFAGTLDGVHGTLESRDDDKFYFTRTTEGATQVLEPDTALLPDIGLAARDSVALLWLGKNSFSEDEDGRDQRIIAITDQAYDWLSPRTTRALVLGHFVNADTSPGRKWEQIHATNAAHKHRYGTQFVDVNEFILSATVWQYAGVQPTDEDLAAQRAGVIAPTLAQDPWHFNRAGYAAVARLVKERLEVLGWY